jgi:ABC-type polysaccharide/polyol phosphate transport system ATPase subunit
MADPVLAETIVAPASADDDVLRVEHIAKRFGATIALRDINLHLRKGEVLGLLGDNGASTTLASGASTRCSRIWRWSTS